MERLLSMTLQEIYDVWKSKFNTFDDMAKEYNVSKKYIDDLMFPIMFYKLDENNKRVENERLIEKELTQKHYKKFLKTYIGNDITI